MLAALAGAGLLVGSVWVVPPLLDWNRYRHAIATIVGTELGRNIVINGDVALRLLPAPVLTATDVDFPDAGDGTSAHLASLRLEVAFGPLLHGQLAVRDLVLGSPMVTLPWPLPASMIRPERPFVPHAFAAHVENGTLRSGQAEITGINAAIHGGPETSLAQDGPVTTFGADGFAAFDGQRWRFTAALGAPDADNVSAVDLAVQGQGAAHDTGGAIVGTLSDGVLQGRLHASGSDLSLLIPASRLAWHAEAPFVASSDRVESSALALRLGDSPAKASFVLHLAAPARLEAALHAATLDLDGWSRLLRGHVAGFAPPVPIKLAIDADRAGLLGSQIGAVGGMLSYTSGQWSLDQVQASVPGGAQLAFSARLSRPDGTAFSVQGPVSLDAPDLHSTLDWLRQLAPGLAGAVPQTALRSARLSFTARVTPEHASLTGISGSLDGSAVSGQAELQAGPHPSVIARGHVARLNLDDWLGAASPRAGIPLAEAAKPFAAHDMTIQVSADTAILAGRPWSNLTLAAATGRSGLRVDSASADAGGVRVKLSGALAPNGAVTAARFQATAPTMQAARAILSAGPGALQDALPALPGPVIVRAYADGPPDALTLQLHAEADNLVAETESRRDTLTGTADTTVTLRHPGASFLLDTLGTARSDRWLGLGPLALLAHLHSTPVEIRIGDVALSAADLQLHGQGKISLSAHGASVDLDLWSPMLPLPAFGMVPAPRLDLQSLLASLQGDIRLKADHIETGLVPVDGPFAATLSAGARNALLLVNGGDKDASLSFSAAVDASSHPAAAGIQGDIGLGALMEQPVGLPLRMSGGRAFLTFDLAAAGDTTEALRADLSGTANLTLRNADISGFDLAQLSQLVAAGAPPPRTAVQAALTSGVTQNMSGMLAARFDHGRLLIGENAFSSIDGSFRLSGTADFSTGLIDVIDALTPATTAPVALSVHYTGAPGTLKTTTDLNAIGDASVRPEKPRKPRPAR